VAQQPFVESWPLFQCLNLYTSVSQPPGPGINYTGPSCYRKKNLPGRGLTKVENHCLTESVGLLGRGISPTQSRYLHTQYNTNRINEDRHRFEPMIPAFELTKTFHALDRAATVIGFLSYSIDMLILTGIHNSDNEQCNEMETAVTS
jgi:hypothetical protein